MNRKDIARITDNAVAVLLDTFRKSPTCFFTGSDVVSYLYYVLQMQKELKYVSLQDRDGRPHFLMHMDFPAPFRCDPGESRFRVREDTERTPEGGLYPRGHYGLVVLNPDFIKKNDCKTIQARDYDTFRNVTVKQAAPDNPIIVCGLEFVYQGAPFISKEETETFAGKAIRGADKLAESVKFGNSGFMENIRVIALVRDRENQLLQERLSRPEIILRFSESKAAAFRTVL